MLLRGLLKFVAVVVAAAAIGVAIGLALGALSGGDESPGTAARTNSTPGATAATNPSTQTETTPATETATSPAKTAPQGTALPGVRVLSAVLFPAATASGRARQRARVSVRVRIRNRDTSTLAPQDPLLLVGADSISSDSRASAVAGSLLKPLAPAATATGELHFETAGAVTQRLNANPNARLRIADRTVAVKITISRTPAPPG